MGQVFADDVAAGRAKDIADKKDIHWKSLHGVGSVKLCSFAHLSAIKLHQDRHSDGLVW